MGAFGVWGGGGVGLGVFSYQSFYLWNSRDGEESALNLKCVFISTEGRLLRLTYI